MLRLPVASLVVLWASLAAARPDDEKIRRYYFGDTSEYFEKHVKPLVAGLRKAKALALIEGLPHQFWEKKLLEKELKAKKTVKLHDFYFYDGPIMVKEEDAKKLFALCRDLKTFGRYRGEKACGGYHPDWCLRFKDGKDVYEVLLCFGCHEARLYGPGGELYSDLDEAAVKKLYAVLAPLHKNRPKREREK